MPDLHQNGLRVNKILSGSYPCAVIIQIRFKGYTLSLPQQAPLNSGFY